MTLSMDQKRSEFRKFVWDHAKDVFQAKFDTRAALTPDELTALSRLLTRQNLASLENMSNAIYHEMGKSIEYLHLLIQIAGLTRNKIIQDIKAHARNNSIHVSLSSPRTLFNSSEGSKLASEYLARQLIRIFAPVETKITPQVFECINQVTWPGYVRQERAKRMGHEAEYRVACLLRDCGLPFAPQKKAENPLCRDIKICSVSYDLVSPSEDNPLVRVKATVHTANIGMYGQSKDDLELRQAAESMKGMPEREKVTLLAFIDGVGFESNRAGLDGILSVADEFCQFRTIWKAAAIVASKIGRRLKIAIPETQIAVFSSFAALYTITFIPIKGDIAQFRHWVVGAFPKSG